MPPEKNLFFEDTSVALGYRDKKELKRSLRLFWLMSSPFLVKTGTWLTLLALKLHLPVKFLIRKTVFRQFCGGETLEDTRTVADELGRHNIYSILDYGIEAREGEEEFDRTVEQLKRTIEFASRHPKIPLLSCKITGMARFALLEKIHAGNELDTNEISEFKRVENRMKEICALAYDKKVGLFIDAEESWIQKPLDQIATTMMEEFNKDRVTVYNTIQFYLKNKLQVLDRAHQLAMDGNYILGIKLVRGAYMDKERKRAALNGYSSPVHESKPAVDQDFNQAMKFCLENYLRVAFCAATHNEESCRLLAEWIDDKSIARDHPHILFSQLYGMSDHITFTLAVLGYRVSKYIPFGPVKEVIPYLIRRAEENTSVGGQVSRELQMLRKELNRRKQTV